MTQPLEQLGSKPATAFEMYRALVGLGVVCGVLIVGAYQATGPIIAKNKAEALERAIFDVIPEASSSACFKPGDDGEFRISTQNGGECVHAGYDQNGQLKGLALEAEATGYQDVVRVLFGYDPQSQAIVGFSVLESRETPGLGDRVATDPKFLENFDALDVRASDGRLVHPIEAVKSGEKTAPWQIDIISGATITSTTVAKMLRDKSAEWIPRLKQHLKEFER